MSQYNSNSGGSGPIPPNVVTELDGNTGSAAPAGGIINVVGEGSAGDGISPNGNIYTVASGNTLIVYETQAQYITNYTSSNVDFAHSPYTITATDYFVSVDSSGGSVTIYLPNSPTIYRMFLIKDRTGDAYTNNVVITTPGGTTLIDGFTTYSLDVNYESASFLFNGTSYEVF